VLVVMIDSFGCSWCVYISLLICFNVHNMDRSKRTHKVLLPPTNNEGPMKRPRGAGDCSECGGVNSMFDKVRRFFTRYLRVK
jgi:hypothetical protein